MKWYFILLIILACLLFLFLLFILPGSKRKCWNIDWLYKSFIAHRGLFNNEEGIVENTSTAFKRAIEKGYNIETDISLTSDDKIIVFHDLDFKRMFNIDKKIHELTLEEIKALNYENSSEKVMEFQEFLDLIDGKTGLLIELKPQPTEKLNALLCDKAMEILRNYKGRYAIQSFHPLIVRYFKKHYPIVPRGQLFGKFVLKDERKKMKGQGFKGVVALIAMFCYNIKFSNIAARPLFIDHDYQKIDFMAKVCHLFMPMIIFTVTDQKTFDKYVKKVDNIIFENLELK